MKMIKVDQQYDRQICQALDMTLIDDYEEQDNDQDASCSNKVANDIAQDPTDIILDRIDAEMCEVDKEARCEQHDDSDVNKEVLDKDIIEEQYSCSSDQEAEESDENAQAYQINQTVMYENEQSSEEESVHETLSEPF